MKNKVNLHNIDNTGLQLATCLNFSSNIFIARDILLNNQIFFHTPRANCLQMQLKNKGDHFFFFQTVSFFADCKPINFSEGHDCLYEFIL